MKAFKFSEIQAQAILDMRLKKLSGLERKKEKMTQEVQALIAELKSILSSAKRFLPLSKGAPRDRRSTAMIAARASSTAKSSRRKTYPRYRRSAHRGGYIKRTDENTGSSGAEASCCRSTRRTRISSRMW